VSGCLDTGVWRTQTIAGGVGNSRQGQSSDCGDPRKVHLWRPSWCCSVGKSLILSDTGNHCVRILTRVAPLAEVLTSLGDIAEAFEMAEETTHNADDIYRTIAKVNLADVCLKRMERSISEDSGKSARAQQGPEGNFSRSSRDAVSSLCSTIPQMLVMMAKQVRQGVVFAW
jgi:hypothetical protein